MATMISISCPECQKKMSAPVELKGKRVRCKGCGNVFPVKEPAAGGAAPAKPLGGAHADMDSDGTPYKVTEESLAPRCPNCANEMESEEAVVCLYCGYNTRTRVQSQTRKLYHHTGMDHFLWLLPGIAWVLAILLIVTFDIVYCLYISDWVKDRWYEFIGWAGIKMWLVIGSLFVIYAAGKFAVRRLIFNPTPPEIELKK